MTNDERIANICDDPRASVSALAWLKEQDPIAALRHPNCPAELWWELAAEYPVEAQESVLYQLVTLENPGRWSKLESDNFKAWITSASDWLTWEQQHLFVADCEEHFLYMYGDQDTELIAKRKEVIRTRRVWGRGGATEVQQSVLSVNVYSHIAVPSLLADVRLSAQRWQWARLQQYLRGEV